MPRPPARDDWRRDCIVRWSTAAPLSAGRRYCEPFDTLAEAVDAILDSDSSGSGRSFVACYLFNERDAPAELDLSDILEEARTTFHDDTIHARVLRNPR